MNTGNQERFAMQYLILKAEPKKGNVLAKKYLGATVGYWIKDQSCKNAYYIAKGLIEDEGWDVLSLEEQYPVEAATYKNESEGKAYYEQALQDEEVLVFYASTKK